MTPKQKEIFCKIWLRYKKPGPLSRRIMENIFSDGCTILQNEMQALHTKIITDLVNETTKLELEIMALKQQLGEINDNQNHQRTINSIIERSSS